MSKVAVDVWVPDLTFPGWMDRWHEQGDAFNAKHSDYEVTIHGKDFWTFPLEVAQAAREGRTPALAEYYFYMLQVARDCLAPDGSPLFKSVEQAVGGRSEILGEPVVLGDLLPAFREYYSENGDLTAMPSVGTTSLLYANTDLLRRAGVRELPQTWAEVEEVCRAVAAMTDGPQFPITWSNHGTFFQQAVASQDGLLADCDNGRAGRAQHADMSSPQMLAWVKWWQQLHRDGHYLYTGKIPDWAGTLKAFADQRVAIRISSSNDVNYMVAAARENGFGIEVGMFPHNDQVVYGGNAVAGTSIWLANNLSEAVEDGALAFLQFLHNPHWTAERHKHNSFVPVTHSAFALLEEQGWFDAHPYHRVASDHVSRYPSKALGPDGSTPTGTPHSRGAVIGDFAGNQDIMTRAMGDVLAAGADPEERFAQATEEATRALQEYNDYALRTGFRSPDDAPGHSLEVEFFTDAAAGRDYSAADLENVVRLAS
jgi:sn-glycerol 3-phosphate transport system substrate-binding protein